MSRKKKNRKSAPGDRTPGENSASPGSVSQILREYWSDVEEHEQLRIYTPGDRSAQQPAPPPAAEDAIRVYTKNGGYRERGDYSVRDILRQFWRDNPQAMADMVALPEPEAETPPEEKEIYYTLREILSQYWRDNPQALADRIPVPEAETAEMAAPVGETGADAEEAAEAPAAGAEKEEGGSGYGAPATPRGSGVERASSDVESVLDEPEKELSFDLREILWEYWHRAMDAAGREAPADAQAPSGDEAGAETASAGPEEETRAGAPIDEPDETGAEGGGYEYREPEPLDAFSVLREYWISGETSVLEDLMGGAEEPPTEDAGHGGAEDAGDAAADTPPVEDAEEAPSDEPPAEDGGAARGGEELDVFSLFNIAGIFGPREDAARTPETEEGPAAAAAPAADAEEPPEEEAPAEKPAAADAEEPPEEELPEEEAPAEAPPAEKMPTEKSAAVYADDMSVDAILAEFRMLYAEDHRGDETGDETGYAVSAGDETTVEAPQGGAERADFDEAPQSGTAQASIDTERPARGEAPGRDDFELTKIFSLGPEAAGKARPAPKAAGGASAAAAGAAAGAVAAAGAGSVAKAAREALAFMSSLTEEDYQKLKDEIEYDKPAPAAEKPAAPAARRDDFGAFNLSGAQSRMVFNGQELDTGPDADYVPPKAPEDSIYHWVNGEEELPDAPAEKPGLLQRILQWNAGGPKKPGKRPLNAPAPRPEDTAAPAEDDDRTQIVSFEDAGAAAYAPDRDYAPAEDEDDGGTQPVSDDAEFPAAAAFSAPQSAAERASSGAPDEGLPFGGEKKEGGSGAERASSDADDDRTSEEFPSFGQFLAAQAAALLVRLRGFGGRGEQAATMDTEQEDLGPELSPMAASKYYGAHARSLRLRFLICLLLLALMAWITLGLPVTGALKLMRVAAAFCLAIHLTVMLLCLDVVANSAVNLLRGRFGADSMAVLLCLLTAFDALAVALNAFGGSHMPLCLFGSGALVGVLFSSLLSARSLRKALRVPAIGRSCSTVTAESGLKGRGLTLIKAARSPAGFVRRSEEAPADETAWYRAAPVLSLLALLMAVIVAAVRHSGGDFLYILSALLSPAIPVTALLAFAAPYFVGSMRIFSSGAALAGWSGVIDIGTSRDLVVSDRDLFPEGSAEIDSIRIFADADSTRIISYTGTMIAASGTGLSAPFGELMERNGGTMRHAENFEILPGGGFQANIDGCTVLCGSTDLMRLMNVRVPFRLVGKTSVLLAIDGVLYGIFNMKYEGLPQVRRALVGLMRSNRHPIFAIRDFNVTPEMLRGVFDLATDGYDFPPYVERFSLSAAQPGSESQIAAVVCREGLGPMTHMADTGRSVYVATRVNLLISLLGAVIGLVTVFVRLLSAGSLGLWFLLVFLLLWALPVAAASLFLKF